MLEINAANDRFIPLRALLAALSVLTSTLNLGDVETVYLITGIHTKIRMKQHFLPRIAEDLMLWKSNFHLQKRISERAPNIRTGEPR